MIPPPNANFSEPSIFHKLEQLYLITHKRVQKFPKIDRYTLGAKIENTILEILELAVHALSKSGASRLLMIQKIDTELKLLVILVRMTYKAKSIPQSGYIEISEKCIELGSMVGGWIKETKTRI